MGRQSSKQAIAWFVTWLAISRGAMSKAAHTPHVNSTSGLIIGHQVPDRPDTFEFLGIKYGQAPVDELRFAPPKRYTASANTVYNASNWNADCPANIAPETKFPNFTNNGLNIINKFTGRLGNQQDEDCLALNIWTKSTSETHPHEPKKPVFAFFHGGRFTIPGPHSPYYNGQYLADNEDVVVVTINYRLGIFGFPGAPGIEQNAGLRDQRSAIEWLRDNISGFGGDPSRIIIFGQSAGGASVDYWAYAYEKDPIIAGIISHSGTALSFIPNRPEYSLFIYNNVTTTLGCSNINTTDADTLSCLRAKPFPAVLAAARNVPALPTLALPQATFHPTIDNTTVFADYSSLGQSGTFAKIPCLAGNNAYEAGTYRVSAFNANVTLSPAQWELFNERAFICPTKYATDFRVAHDVPIWRYRYMGDYENLQLYDSWGEYPSSGAYHGAELSELFGTAENVSAEASSMGQERFSRYMQGAWAAFGRDPWRGLTKEYGWPGYNASTESLVKLAPGGGLLKEFVDPAVYDGQCPQVEDNDPRPGRGAF